MARIKVLKRFHESLVQYLPGAVIKVTDVAAKRWALQGLVEVLPETEPEFATSRKHKRA